MVSMKKENSSSSKRYCNNVFPNISTSQRPALCCSAFPPFLIEFLMPDDRKTVDEFSRLYSELCAHEVGDSCSTLLCKAILQQHFRMKPSSRQAMLMPFFQKLHKFKSRTSLMYSEICNNDDDPRNIECGKSAGTLVLNVLSN